MRPLRACQRIGVGLDLRGLPGAQGPDKKAEDEKRRGREQHEAQRLVPAAVLDGRADWSLLRENALHRQRTCFSDRSMTEGVAAVYRQAARHMAARLWASSRGSHSAGDIQITMTDD